MEFCISQGTFGLNRKYVLGKVAEGDGVACYVTKESKVIGLGTVVRGYYVDVTPVFVDEAIFGTGYNLYPDRIDFHCEALPPPFELDFTRFLNQMSFIKNVAHWSVYFSTGIKEISAEDWKVLSENAGHATS